MQDFRKLKVWEKARQLSIYIYRFTKTSSKEEMFDLTCRLRRAMTSIPTNLAESVGRGTDFDFARFVQNAMGSACETEYLLFLSLELRYCTKENYETLSKEITAIKKMLTSLIKKLRADS